MEHCSITITITHEYEIPVNPSPDLIGDRKERFASHQVSVAPSSPLPPPPPPPTVIPARRRVGVLVLVDGHVAQLLHVVIVVVVVVVIVIALVLVCRVGNLYH